MKPTTIIIAILGLAFWSRHVQRQNTGTSIVPELVETVASDSKAVLEDSKDSDVEVILPEDVPPVRLQPLDPFYVPPSLPPNLPETHAVSES